MGLSELLDQSKDVSV